MEAGLSLDVVGAPDLLPDVARLAGELPGMSIIVDHLAGVHIDGAEPPSDWRREMASVARQPTVFCKVSGLVEGTGRRGGQAPTDPAFYRPILDFVTNTFGPDRLIYGSNWPVCEHFATLETVHRLVADYFAGAGTGISEGVFRTNASRAYRWVVRS
jgi:predicted TIM-barrel fold metal-dependent hydrolase